MFSFFSQTPTGLELLFRSQTFRCILEVQLLQTERLRIGKYNYWTVSTERKRNRKRAFEMKKSDEKYIILNNGTSEKNSQKHCCCHLTVLDLRRASSCEMFTSVTMFSLYFTDHAGWNSITLGPVKTDVGGLDNWSLELLVRKIEN